MGTERSRIGQEEADLPAALIGRGAELRRLLALVDGIRDHGGALVVRGEAGVGKSALLAAVSAGASAQGVAVFRTTAVESEMRLPFAGLHELLLPFLDRIDRLPTVQRSALEMALGLAPREAVPDIFLIGLATLALVADVAAEAPLLFVVEDAQWIDRSSGMVLGFVARRLEMEPVLMWFAVRAGVMSDVGRAGLPEFDLQSLGEEASARLLDAQAPDLSADLKRRILDEALGNPLALIELPVAAKDAAFDTRPALPGSLPLTARLERAFAARLAELDADARALLLVAALEDGEPGGSVITAAGTDDRVAGLVYIAALAPDEDETTQSQLEKFPASDVLKFVEPADGRLWLNREGVECFAGDLAPEEKGVVWATQFPPAADLFSGNAPGVAWKTKPSWYIVATKDQTVQPDLERFVAKRMNATTYEVESSHVVMLSQPEFVLDVIRDAAAAIEKDMAASLA